MRRQRPGKLYVCGCVFEVCVFGFGRSSEDFRIVRIVGPSIEHSSYHQFPPGEATQDTIQWIKPTRAVHFLDTPINRCTSSGVRSHPHIHSLKYWGDIKPVQTPGQLLDNLSTPISLRYIYKLLS